MSDVTLLLDAVALGHADAQSRLLCVVYDELRAIAAMQFSREPSNPLLQPTALVHEAYLRLL